jgi:dUTP pyrophosphatase
LSITIKFKRLHTYAELPKYATGGSACCDAILPTTYPALEPGEIRVVPLGFAVQLPDGWELQVRPRSGLASRGIVVANSPGCIDADYRGEVGVILMNMSGAIQPLLAGDRICQLKVAEAHKIQWEIVDEIDCTERGDGSYGSTGGVTNAE